MNGSLEELPPCESSLLGRLQHKIFPFVLFGSRLLACHWGSKVSHVHTVELRSKKAVVMGVEPAAVLSVETTPCSVLTRTPKNKSVFGKSRIDLSEKTLAKRSFCT